MLALSHRILKKNSKICKNIGKNLKNGLLPLDTDENEPLTLEELRSCFLVEK
jgi:hypothetical protein